VNGARAHILAAVKTATARRRHSDVTASIGDHIRPARAMGDQGALVRRFCEMAEFAGAQVCRVMGKPTVPTAVATYLSDHDIGDEVLLSSDPAVKNLPWSTVPRLLLRTGVTHGNDRVSVTSTVSGVAETGTLLVTSSATTPNALHLLPDAHIAIIEASAIVGSYEEAFARLKGGLGALPRVATFITGPSRTADIEKTPQIGVHGPRQLFIVVIDDPTA
jgi:L-lactate dehydrogenase complex protein LldG